MKRDPENLKLTHEVAYDWNKTGQLAAVTSPAGKFEYGYDKQSVSVTWSPD